MAKKTTSEVTRYVSRKIERELWARSAGRCERQACNKLLYRSSITQERVSLAERAHIYPVSETGPRGLGPLKKLSPLLNDPANLILVCPECHKTMDADTNGERYAPSLLQQWKVQHETRIELVTGIEPDLRTKVVLYEAKIGPTGSPIQIKEVMGCLFPERNPIDADPANLSMFREHEDDSPDYWITEETHLKRSFERKIRDRIEDGSYGHLSLFALAPQPLLMVLGSLFTDRVDLDVHQLHREPRTWRWLEDDTPVSYMVDRPMECTGIPILILSISDRISRDRVERLFRHKTSIWEIFVDGCNLDIIRSRRQLSAFRKLTRELLAEIRSAHGLEQTLHVFPTMPVSAAVEFGRCRMGKIDMPWILYEQNPANGGFFPVITLSKET
jgi:hypothetical protein